MIAGKQEIVNLIPFQKWLVLFVKAAPQLNTVAEPRLNDVFTKWVYLYAISCKLDV
jgi:hypothetical protein